MELKDKFLSAENCENGDIITFIDEGKEEPLEAKQGEKPRNVVNFTVSNGRYELIYTPGITAQKEFIKAWGRDTAKFVGKKFTVKIVETMSFGKIKKMIFPVPILL